MDPTKPPSVDKGPPNAPPNPTSGAPNPNLSTSTPQSTSKTPVRASPWASQTTTFSASNSGSPGFPQFSAATAEILKRLQANQSNAAGTAAFEAKRAEVLQNYVTSDKLPAPPPIAGSGRRGRGGKVSTPSGLKTEAGASSAGSTPASGRGSGTGRGSGRGRGRARGSGRGGKRRRAESAESDDDSDISSSYTPLPTRTKSGRNVNKPVAFVPTLPEPSPGVKRRRSTKQVLAAQCKICNRATDPGNNRIVFCDVCSAAYHQYCHDPPIDNEVVNVLEKEWLCGPCERSKQNVVEGMDGLVAAEGLSIEDKRVYFSTLPQTRLVSLLLHATIRHPELPIFPPNVQDLIPDSKQLSTSNSSAAAKLFPKKSSSATAASIASPQNGHGSLGGTPRSSELDAAEAQLIGEITRSHNISSPKALQPPSTSTPSNPGVSSNHGNTDQMDEYDDGYDTDPPAHYPKPGNGLARTLRPESEDLQWLVDDNFEVFSHGWKGDGTGIGADGTLNGLGEAMEGVEGSKA